MSKRIIITLLLVCIGAGSCENYQSDITNGAFRLSVSVGACVAGEPVPFSLFFSDGYVGGDCFLRVQLTDCSDGSTPSYELLLNGNAVIGEDSPWTFDGQGEARFAFSSLPQGDYDAVFTVTRWYHTASCMTRLSIKP